MTKKKHTEYINRVRKGIEVYEAMEDLSDGEELTIVYGERGEFKIRCYQYTASDKKSYSISETKDYIFGRSMNIDSEKSGKSYLYCYTFDLFNNKTVSKLNFDHINFL